MRKGICTSHNYKLIAPFELFIRFLRPKTNTTPKEKLRGSDPKRPLLECPFPSHPLHCPPPRRKLFLPKLIFQRTNIPPTSKFLLAFSSNFLFQSFLHLTPCKADCKGEQDPQMWVCCCLFGLQDVS